MRLKAARPPSTRRWCHAGSRSAPAAKPLVEPPAIERSIDLLQPVGIGPAGAVPTTAGVGQEACGDSSGGTSPQSGYGETQPPFIAASGLVVAGIPRGNDQQPDVVVIAARRCVEALRHPSQPVVPCCPPHRLSVDPLAWRDGETGQRHWDGLAQHRLNDDPKAFARMDFGGDVALGALLRGADGDDDVTGGLALGARRRSE